MGSTTMIDIVSSLLISGLLLFVALQMDAKSVQNTFDSQASLTVQENLTSLVENLEFDFRKIGYVKNQQHIEPMDCIQAGTVDSIAFVADVDNVGSPDTVKYWLGTTAIQGCPNPAVRMLYRQINNGTEFASNLGLTQFELHYYNSEDSEITPPISSPNGVQLIEITMKVEPTASYDAAYDSIYAVWRQTRLVSRNLTQR